jgi:perosamine synthetase
MEECMIPQIEPSFDWQEVEALANYASSGGWFTEHVKTRELEGMIADFLGVKHCLMVPNGTLALYAALSSLGVMCGHEVIIPAFTMIATANAVKMTGATPVFVDIQPDTLCMDAERAMDAITDRTTAIIPVALNGRCPDMNTLKQCYLPIVEDAAQAMGSLHNGEPIGTLGDMGCFSFSPHKIISTGQGGCVVTNGDALEIALRHFKNFGRPTGGGYDHNFFGVNLKFTDLQAVVGIEQVKKLPNRIKRKREMYSLYRDLLDGVSQVHFVPTDLSNTTPWYMDVLVDDRREELITYLKENGVGAHPVYPALHQTPVYCDPKLSFPVAEDLARRGLWLPSSVKLRDSEIELVCGHVRQFYEAS